METNIGSDSPVAVKHTTAGYTGRYGQKKGAKRAYAAEKQRNPKGRISGRRYGPQHNEEPVDGLPMPQSIYSDLSKMDDAQLRQYALANFGQRFSDKEKRDSILTSIRNMGGGRAGGYA
jgi:hypothetical protein